MPIYTKLNRTVGPRVIEDFTASRGQVATARFGASFALTPLASANRFDELREAMEHGEMVSVDEANEIGGPIGLQFEKDISRPALDIMVNRKKKEQERQSTIMRSQGGFVSGVTGFAADLFAQAVDPINIAASFVPVVGQTRYANWAARIGKGNARFARGAIEGAVGNTLVEPIVLVAATQEQADYQMIDSLMNVGFGALIGGGLHTLGGRIGDAVTGANAKMVAALNQHERSKIQGAVLADIVEGRDIDVTPAYKASTAEARVKPDNPDPSVVRGEEPAPRTDIDPTVARRMDEGESLDDLVAEGVLSSKQALELKAEDPANRGVLVNPRQEVQDIHARQDDPANQRLGDAQAAERTKKEVAETPDYAQPTIQERLLGEEQAMLDVEVRGIKESELGDDLLEASGVEVRKEGPATTAALKDAQESIDKAKVEVRAVDALADCVGR